jgi:hypothetical protein
VLPGALLRGGGGGRRRLAAVLPVRAPLLGAGVPIRVLVPAGVAQNPVPSGSPSCARNHPAITSHEHGREREGINGTKKKEINLRNAAGEAATGAHLPRFRLRSCGRSPCRPLGGLVQRPAATARKRVEASGWLVGCARPLAALRSVSGVRGRRKQRERRETQAPSRRGIMTTALIIMAAWGPRDPWPARQRHVTVGVVEPGGPRAAGKRQGSLGWSLPSRAVAAEGARLVSSGERIPAVGGGIDGGGNGGDSPSRCRRAGPTRPARRGSLAQPGR